MLVNCIFRWLVFSYRLFAIAVGVAQILCIYPGLCWFCLLKNFMLHKTLPIDNSHSELIPYLEFNPHKNFRPWPQKCGRWRQWWPCVPTSLFWSPLTAFSLPLSPDVVQKWKQLTLLVILQPLTQTLLIDSFNLFWFTVLICTPPYR